MTGLINYPNWNFIRMSNKTHDFVNFIIYVVFFSAAFFIPLGLSFPFFFPLKHFHVSLGALVLFCLAKEDLIGKVKTHYHLVFPLISWLAILFVSYVSNLAQGESHGTLMMTLNLLSLVISSSFLIWILADKKEAIPDAILFFVFGVCIRVILAAAKSFRNWPASEMVEGLIHNNHIGFVTSGALFLLLPFLLMKYNFKKQLAAWGMFITILIGLLLSCSRTAWLSTLVGYFLFCVFLFFLDQTHALPTLRIPIKGFIWGVSLFFYVALLLSIFSSPETKDRFAAMQILFEPSHWDHALTHDQNFGPLGFLRLDQFFATREIWRHHGLFGVGFSRYVMDFHCLYLTMLGASGVLGSLFFLFFCFLWLKELFSAMLSTANEFNLFRVGILCAFCAWLTTSFLETFLIQFNIWILIVAGIIMSSAETKQTRLYNYEN